MSLSEGVLSGLKSMFLEILSPQESIKALRWVYNKGIAFSRDKSKVSFLGLLFIEWYYFPDMCLPRWQHCIGLIRKIINLTTLNSEENVLFLCCLVFMSKSLRVMLRIKDVKKKTTDDTNFLFFPVGMPSDFYIQFSVHFKVLTLLLHISASESILCLSLHPTNRGT